MRLRLKVNYLKTSVGFLSLSLIYWGWGCSTAEIRPIEAPDANPPAYAAVVHPEGYDLADLREVFFAPGTPKPETLEGCDANFRKLESYSLSNEERTEGVRELVKQDPVLYHYCFYSRILWLEEQITSPSTYIDQRQKLVLDTYGFLVPIARAFASEYHDSRYLRWAVSHYRQMSPWVFYRNLTTSPQFTSDVVEVASPFGLWRDPAPTGNTILEKYGIVKPASEPDASRSPAGVASPGPSPALETGSAAAAPTEAATSEVSPAGAPAISAVEPDSAPSPIR